MSLQPQWLLLSYHAMASRSANTATRTPRTAHTPARYIHHRSSTEQGLATEPWSFLCAPVAVAVAVTVAVVAVIGVVMVAEEVVVEVTR